MWAHFSSAVSKIQPIFFSLRRRSQVLSTTSDLCKFITQKASTLPTDYSDDSWRDIFFGKHEHGALWLLICGAIEKHLLAYLLAFLYNTANVTLRVFCACALQRYGTRKYHGTSLVLLSVWHCRSNRLKRLKPSSLYARSSATAEGPRDALSV